MMDDRGKSDSLVVPSKSSNKAGQPAAETAEGSGLAKGNSPEGHDARTQRRVHASDGIERVRQAARRRDDSGSPRCCTTSTTSSVCERRTSR